MIRFPFSKKIKVLQLVSNAFTKEPERKEITMPMDELLIQLLTEQGAMLSRIEHHLSLITAALQPPQPHEKASEAMTESQATVE